MECARSAARSPYQSVSPAGVGINLVCSLPRRLTGAYNKSQQFRIFAWASSYCTSPRPTVSCCAGRRHPRSILLSARLFNKVVRRATELRNMPGPSMNISMTTRDLRLLRARSFLGRSDTWQDQWRVSESNNPAVLPRPPESVQAWNTGQVSKRCRLGQLKSSPLYAMVIHR
jgi:hypothetical protein